MFYEWEEPLPTEPKGVVVHRDSVLFGRKLSGKSQRELEDLGLSVESRTADSPPEAVVPSTA